MSGISLNPSIRAKQAFELNQSHLPSNKNIELPKQPIPPVTPQAQDPAKIAAQNQRTGATALAQYNMAMIKHVR